MVDGQRAYDHDRDIDARESSVVVLMLESRANCSQSGFATRAAARPREDGDGPVPCAVWGHTCR